MSQIPIIPCKTSRRSRRRNFTTSIAPTGMELVAPSASTAESGMSSSTRRLRMKQKLFFLSFLLFVELALFFLECISKKRMRGADVTRGRGGEQGGGGVCRSERRWYLLGLLGLVRQHEPRCRRPCMSGTFVRPCPVTGRTTRRLPVNSVGSPRLGPDSYAVIVYFHLSPCFIPTGAPCFTSLGCCL